MAAHKLNIVFALLVCAYGVGVAQCHPEAAGAPGIRGSVSQSGIRYFLSIAVPLIEEKFSTVDLPDMSFDKDSISGSVSSIVCSNLHLGSATATLEPHQGLHLAFAGIAVDCHADWSYHENIWPHIPHGSGDVQANSEASAASITVDLINHDSKPNIVASDCSASVSISYLEFHGGLSGDILNLFKGLIRGHLESTLNGQLCGKITGFLNTDANVLLDGFGLNKQIPAPAPFNISEAFFGLSSNPIFQATYIGLNLQGMCENIHTKQPPPFGPPAIPQFTSLTGDTMLQTYLSSYIFNTASWVFFEAGLMAFTLTPADVPASSPIHLNTSDFSVLAPGLYQQYPNEGVDIRIDVTAPPVLSSSRGGVNLTVGLNFTFMAVTPKGPAAAFTVNCTATTGMTVVVKGVNNERLVGQLDGLSCPLQLVTSSVGTVQVGDMQFLVSAVFDLLEPKVNKLLASGFPLPIIDGVQFVNTKLAFGPDFVLVATDMHIDPAATRLRMVPGYSFSSNGDLY